MAGPHHVHTDANAVPPLDDELGGVLDDLADIHAGIDLIRDGIRLLDADTNPALRTLSFEAQKETQRHGENLLRHLADPDLHQHASNASGAIHTD